MGEIFGKNYYLDLDAAVAVCKTGDNIQDEDGKDIVEINVFKYEMVKMMLETILSEHDDIDDSLGLKSASKTSVPFKIAFNSLLNKKLINLY